MRYVGDLSRKKEEHALPCGGNYNLWCREDRLLAPLGEFSVDQSVTGGGALLTYSRVSDCQNKS